MSLVLHNLRNTAAIIYGLNAVGFTITAVYETHKLTDLVGVGSFVAAAVQLSSRKSGIFSMLTSMKKGILVDNFVREMLVNVGVMLWGSRLANYLFQRVLQVGEDKRLDHYFKKKDEKYLDSSKSFYPVKLGTFWVIQATWGFLCTLPLVFLNSFDKTITPNLFIKLSDLFKISPRYFSAISFIPIAGIYSGIILEWIADYQKSQYRSNPKNKNHWCDVGVWSLSRYPNYFGEMLTWWSIYASCLPVLPVWQALIGLVSPVFVTFLLFKVSGIPLLEKKNDRLYSDNAEYQIYKKNTPLLIPIPKLFHSDKSKKN